jgi:hypothetical protein
MGHLARQEKAKKGKNAKMERIAKREKDGE